MWSDEAATLAAERGSWFMVRPLCSGCTRKRFCLAILGSGAPCSPSGVFLSSSDRTPLLRPAAARRPKQLLPEDVCACTSLEQAINGDHISLFNPAQLTVCASCTEPLPSSAQVRAADEDPMQPSDDSGAHDVPAPIGHVSVCGVELRMSACPPERGRQPPVLVKTATVEQNLKSLALALCGVRVRLHRTAHARALSAACEPAPLDSKHTNWNASRRQDTNSRYPYEGAGGGSCARPVLLHVLTRSAHPADASSTAGGAVRLRQERPSATPCILHRRAALPRFPSQPLAAMHVRITSHTLR